MSDHGGTNVVHVAGEEEDAGDDDGASDAGEQFFISFGADAAERQGGVHMHDVLAWQNGS